MPAVPRRIARNMLFVLWESGIRVAKKPVSAASQLDPKSILAHDSEVTGDRSQCADRGVWSLSTVDLLGARHVAGWPVFRFPVFQVESYVPSASLCFDYGSARQFADI